MEEKEHDSKSKLAAITEIVQGRSKEEICKTWDISIQTLEKWIEQFCSRSKRLSELPEEPPETPESEEVKRSDVLAVYGSYTNSMEGIMHFDQLAYASEAEATSANWYAITAVLVIFSLTQKSYHLALVLTIIVGLIDLSYLTSRFVITVIKNERFGAAYFFNAIKMENKYPWLPPLFHNMFSREYKEKKDGSVEVKRISYHGSPYLKASFFFANLIVPFIFIFPSLYQLEAAQHWTFLDKLPIPLYASYTLIGLLIYAAYILILIQATKPFMGWLKKIETSEV